MLCGDKGVLIAFVARKDNQWVRFNLRFREAPLSVTLKIT
jgi:hypothetical protein